MARHNEVRVAATYDQTLSDSDNIEGFTPSGGSPATFNIPGVGSVYFAVGMIPQYSRGEFRLDPNGGSSFAGLEQVRYLQKMCHADSLVWLIANYEGQVTAQVRTIGTTYAEYNCELRFEYVAIENRPNWFEVTWIFALVEAL